MTPIVDIEKIRTDFPILSDQIFGKPLIYFDNAATTQKPRCVLDKMTELYTTQNANIHRGVHHLSQLATAAHRSARQTVADFIHANDAKRNYLYARNYRIYQSGGFLLFGTMPSGRRNCNNANGTPFQYRAVANGCRAQRFKITRCPY